MAPSSVLAGPVSTWPSWCPTSGNRGSDRRKTRNCSGRSRPTRDCSSRCWSSRIPTSPISTGSSTASGAGRTRSAGRAGQAIPVRQIPVEITDRTLTDEERLRVWIYIHRQRKEWDATRKGDGRLPARRASGPGRTYRRTWSQAPSATE